MTLGSARRLLVLARHGQSEGNQQNIFTGWRDVPLTDQGRTEAETSGRRLFDLQFRFKAAFTSKLSRASDSCRLILDATNSGEAIITSDASLNERDYGDLTGLNKDEARERFGADQVQEWRRSYAVAPPNGESLRDTVARVLPFYISHILPAVMKGGGVLVVAHGNSLRALILALEGLSADKIASVELQTGELRFYALDENAAISSTWSWVPASAVPFIIG
jgi:2,3-bisphosphoglycerate-dependent phosphoglycerate mutase